MCAGCTSTTSPRTRKRPRPRNESLREYWMSTSFRSMTSRSISIPTPRTTVLSSYSIGEPMP